MKPANTEDSIISECYVIILFQEWKTERLRLCMGNLGWECYVICYNIVPGM